ncbi:cytochrome P450 monooxygenase pc-1 [Flagelloscypha sp. PMI_526]|nr:cytochrome P450 monooxygenase pc-1 [Flagelloscypha sp. PMI_526]
MRLTPGLRFLLARAHILCLPVLFYAGAGRFFPLLPTWVLVPLSLATVPAYSAYKIISTHSKYARDARQRGARVLPLCKGRLPGNYDILESFFKDSTTGNLGDTFARLHEQYGECYDLGLLWDQFFFTTSPEHIKIILSTNFDNFEKGENFFDCASSVLGSGVFNSDGDIWKFHRGLTRPHFNREKVQDFDLFEHHSNLAILKIQEHLKTGHAVDIQVSTTSEDVFGRFAIDAASAFLFGTSLNTLSEQLPLPYPNISSSSGHPFAIAFSEALDIVSKRILLGWIWPLAELWKEKADDPMKEVRAFLQPIVQNALQKHKRDKDGLLVRNEDDGNDTLLDHLAKQSADPKLIQDEILNILLAGRDTTAATLTFLTHFLSIYPNICQKLRAEILGRVGPSRRPTFDDIREMKYLRAVINETLRLYPVVPLNVRASIGECFLPSSNPDEPPFYLPPKTNINYGVHFMHRRKDLWGPDATEFDPDRFLDERAAKYYHKNPFIFLPFNAGPRICLGQQFAYNEMSYFIIRLLQTFDSFTPVPEARKPEDRVPGDWKMNDGWDKDMTIQTRKVKDGFRLFCTLTMSIRGGLWLKAHEAS